MSRRHYSDSRLFRWLRVNVFKVDKPVALEWGGWDKWDEKTKAERPLAYFFTETLPDWLEKPAEWLIDPIYDVKYYMVNRWIDKTHVLESKLSKGKWHELETRLLHCMFDELINHVEIEMAWSHIAWSDQEERAKYHAPWYATGWFRTRTWRCPEAALDHLRWEQGLVWKAEEVGEDSELVGQRMDQAVRADEILALYTWWKETRPSRGDAWDVTGFRAFWKSMDAKYDDSDGERTSWINFKKNDKNLTPEEDAEYWRLHKLVEQQEQAWETEDENMMIRLIKVRRGLWT